MNAGPAWRRTVAGGLIGLVLAGGCAPRPAGPLHVWAVGDCQLVGPADPPREYTEVFDARRGGIRLEAAANEVVAFQLVMRAARGPVRGVRVEIDPLLGEAGSGRIEPPAVRMYREWYVPVDQYPGWFMRRIPRPRRVRWCADVLIPLDTPGHGQPLTVQVDANVAVWVDIAVPEQTPAGLYRGSVRVRWPAGSVRLPLRLRVWPVVLPEQAGLAVLAPVDHRKLLRHALRRNGEPYAPERISVDDPMAAEATRVVAGAFRLLGEHRCCGFLSGYRPVMKLDQDGKVRVDWQDYDRLVTALLDVAGGAAAWPMPVDAEFPVRFAPDARPAGADQGQYEAVLREYLAECARHFEARGWLDRHFVWIPLGAMGLSERFVAVPRLSRLVHEADARLRLVWGWMPQDMARFGWWRYPYQDVRSAVDIWAPPGRYWDTAAMAEERAKGKATWLRVDEPPYTGSLAIGAPPADVRSIGWQAFREGARVVLLKHANDWPANVRLRELSARGAATDRWLMYPGERLGLREPLPSVRLKRLRRGIQDAELLGLLERAHRGKVAELIAQTVFKFGGTRAYGDNLIDPRPFGWVLEPRLWMAARRLALRELVRAAGGQVPESRRQRELAWVRFLRAGRKIRLLPVGARVRPAEPEADKQVLVQFTVLLVNETRRTVSGVLRFDGLPEGWRPVRDRLAIAGLKPMSRRQEVLTARAEAIAASLAGTLAQPIVFEADGYGRVVCQVRLGYVAASRLSGPIEVDGDLADWPAGRTNVAGDFLLLGRERFSEAAAVENRPTQPTTVFVGQDGTYLYVAFHCAEREPERIRTTGTTQVRYDGPTPTGEDLVEVLIDPLNTDSTDPSDLYHIVVKPSGAGFWEQGVGLSPPAGQRRSWPADVTWAVGRAAGRWFAEIRIPLAGFGAVGRRNRCWRINFARLEARLGEYASWSGAIGHVYSPRRLGNLVWP